MKTSLTFMLIATVLFLGACKKKEAESVTPGGDNSWTLGGISYKTALSYRSPTSGGTTLLNFYDATPSSTVKVNSLAFSFTTLPTASGTYQLVNVGQAKTASQFELSAGTSAGAAYAFVNTSSPTASVDVTITVTGGKVKIVIPEITLKSTGSTPDIKLTASVQEL